MKRRQFLGVVISFFMVCGLSYADTGVIVGTITYTEGIIDILVQGDKIVVANKEDIVHIGDRIRTKKYSKAEITFIDKSIVRLAPSTCIFVDEYLVKKNRRELANIKLTRGKMEAVVSRTGRPETFIITTPNAVGKVKGSDIFMSYQAGQTGALIKKGLMSLSNLSVPDAIVDMRRGDYSSVPFDEIPNLPRSYFDVELKRHEKEVTPVLIKKWVPTEGAEKLTGKITGTINEVRIFKKGADDWQQAAEGEQIGEGDKVQTGEDSSAEIIFENGNALILRANTEFAILSLRVDPSTGVYHNSFQSTKGKIKAVVSKIDSKSTFEVRTPTAVCGVAGTVMYLDVEQAATQAFYEGGGGIVTSTISGHSEMMRPGSNTIANIEGTILPPMITMNEQRMSLGESFGKHDMGMMMKDYSMPMGPMSPDDSFEFGPRNPHQAEKMHQGMMENYMSSAAIIEGFLGEEIRPYDEVFNPNPIYNPAEGILLERNMPTNPYVTSDWLGIINNATLRIRDNGTWTASVQGVYVSDPQPNWDLGFISIDGKDSMQISGTDPWQDNTWHGTVTSVTGMVTSTPVAKTYGGVVTNGQYMPQDGGSGGVYQGQAQGTWTNIP